MLEVIRRIRFGIHADNDNKKRGTLPARTHGRQDFPVFRIQLDKHAGDKIADLSLKLRRNILDFFEDRPAALAALHAPESKKKEREEWQKALSQVEQLKSMPAVEAPVSESEIAR